MELIAVRDGFYHGVRVRRGELFSFDENEMVQARENGKPAMKDGKPVMVKVKVPKWGKAPSEARAVMAAEESRKQIVDTKPLAAAAAAKRRATAE